MSTFDEGWMPGLPKWKRGLAGVAVSCSSLHSLYKVTMENTSLPYPDVTLDSRKP